MPSKQPEQGQERPVSTGKSAADSIARAGRIRGAASPFYLMVMKTIKAIEDEEKKGAPRDTLYYDLRNLKSPLERILRRSQEEFNKRLIAALETAGTEAVEAHRAAVRARRKKKGL